jgi:2TM domain
MMNDSERYQQARTHVQQLRGLYVHAGVFVVVNLSLLLLNLITNPQSLWFYWPLIGWGIGLIAHAFVVLWSGGILGKEWEERKIRELMDQDVKREEAARPS